MSLLHRGSSGPLKSANSLLTRHYRVHSRPRSVPILHRSALAATSGASSPYSTLLSSHNPSSYKRGQLLQRPSTTTFTLQPRQQCRQFSVHSTAVSLVDTVESMILSLHDITGLPWMVTVPLAAIILRVVLTLPFSIYAHRRVNKVVELDPLLQAWSKVIMKRVAGGKSAPGVEDGIVGHSTVASAISASVDSKSGRRKPGPSEFITESAKQTRAKRIELYKRTGTQVWKSWLGLVQVPIWIFASLAIRRLSGFETAMWWGVGLGKNQDALAATTAESMSYGASDSLPIEGGVPATTSAAAAEIVPDATGNMATAAESGLLIPYDQSDAAELARQSMALESIPEWFPTLLAPDPLFILPLLFSFSVFLNIEIQSYRSPARSAFQRIIRNSIRLVALILFPLTANQPVVLHLYWCTSALYSVCQNVILNMVWPTVTYRKEETKETPLQKWTQVQLRDEEKEENFKFVDGRKVFTKRLHGSMVSKDDWMWDYVALETKDKVMEKGELGLEWANQLSQQEVAEVTKASNTTKVQKKHKSG